MATTACSVRIPTCSGDSHLTLLRPWKLLLQIHRTHTKGRCTRRASTQVEAGTQTWRCSPTTQRGARTQNWSCSLNIQNKACTQHVRRFSSTPNGARTQILGFSSSRASTQNWRCFASTESGQEEIELKGSELELRAQSEYPVEKKEPGYVGRALRAGKGALIAELLQIFGNLLERPYGGGESVANAGAVVIERVVSDAQALRGQEGVSDQIIFEMLKVLRLLEMDMDLVRAARKEETLLERLETAKAHWNRPDYTFLEFFFSLGMLNLSCYLPNHVVQLCIRGI